MTKVVVRFRSSESILKRGKPMPIVVQEDVEVDVPEAPVRPVVRIFDPSGGSHVFVDQDGGFYEPSLWKVGVPASLSPEGASVSFSPGSLPVEQRTQYDAKRRVFVEKMSAFILSEGTILSPTHAPNAVLMDGGDGAVVLFAVPQARLPDGYAVVLPWSMVAGVLDRLPYTRVEVLDVEALAAAVPIDVSEVDRSLGLVLKNYMDKASHRLDHSTTDFARFYVEAKEALDANDLGGALGAVRLAGAEPFGQYGQRNPLADPMLGVLADTFAPPPPALAFSKDLSGIDEMLAYLNVVDGGRNAGLARRVEDVVWGSPHRHLVALLEETADWEDALGGENPELVQIREVGRVVVEGGLVEARQAMDRFAVETGGDVPVDLDGDPVREVLRVLYDETLLWEQALSGERPSLVAVMDGVYRSLFRISPLAVTDRQTRLENDRADVPEVSPGFR